MAFELYNFEQLSHLQKEKFYKFCKEASEENLPAAVNMWNKDWQNSSQSLPYILEKTSRFSHKGQFHILFSEEEVVLCGGVYFADFNRNIAIAGTRTWVKKEFRNLALTRDYLFPEHKKWALENNCKQIIVCFNEYNKNLKRIFFRNRLGEENKRIFLRSKEHLFYSNINEVPFTVNIQDTPQWVLYEKLDSNWEFDWSTIKSNVHCTH